MEYVYAALLLHKLGKPIEEDAIIKIIKASGADVDEAKVKTLIASLKGLDIDAELANAVAMSASAAPVSSNAGSAKPAEEPKEEKREESVAGLSALFG